MATRQGVEFSGKFRFRPGRVGHFLGNRNDVHAVFEKQANLRCGITHGRTGRLNRNAGLGGREQAAQIVFERDTELPVQAHRRTDIDGVFTAATTESACQFDPFLLEQQSDHAGSHLPGAENHSANRSRHGTLPRYGKVTAFSLESR